jgi:vanillate O-demethylase ferredoxin subunit
MQSNSASATARLREARPIASDVRLMRFEIVDGTVHNTPGAHLTFALPLGGGTTRSYSVIDDGLRSDLVSIAVKRESPGRGGSAHMWSLDPGADIHIVESGNSLPVSYAAKDYLLIAGGIGVTPLTSVASALRSADRPVRMAYCAKSADHAAFADRLTELLGDRIAFHFSDQGSRLDVERLIDTVEPGTQVYFCGPQRLSDAIKRAWAVRKLPVADLRYETFASSGRLPVTSFSVTVEETGQTVDVPPDITLLEALVGSGHEIMYECMRGECGLCKLVVTAADAEIDHRDVFLSEHEKSAGDSICACVSRLSGGHARIRVDGISHGRSGG